MKILWVVLVSALVALSSARAVAQMGPMRGQSTQEQGATGTPMEHPHTPTPFYQEHTFMVLLGLGIGVVAIFAYRAGRAWWRRRHAPAGFLSEAVLVVDLVNSTHFATHYGDGLAMRARNMLKDRVLTLAEARGLTFAENTGDGCFMTFPSVLGAGPTAIALLKQFRDRPPDLSPGPPPDLRMGISYGEIILDAGGARHGAAINKAFRLEGLSRESFTQVVGETLVDDIADRNRIYLDEEAMHELGTAECRDVPLRFVGFARLKGFSGLHRVYELLWQL